ncbi:hypothetical protein CSAL01_11484 [Colletotrichum salicis]|uniref:Uncharacterized protein n=1 Tax=Colletotrichum salicis TaxID=1209931 RepID=A0A135V939_9PEZI|nr:hypothetical protein CSAL01_11484 [Colletotrichum salicis]
MPTSRATILTTHGGHWRQLLPPPTRRFGSVGVRQVSGGSAHRVTKTLFFVRVGSFLKVNGAARSSWTFRAVGVRSEASIYSALPNTTSAQHTQSSQAHSRTATSIIPKSTKATTHNVIMAVSNAIQDLFSSIYELLSSIFNAFYHVLQTIFNTIIGFFTGLVNLITDVFQGAIDVVGGFGKFVLSNFVIIGVIAAGGYAYVRYTSQGRQVATGKKTA